MKMAGGDTASGPVAVKFRPTKMIVARNMM